MLSLPSKVISTAYYIKFCVIVYLICLSIWYVVLCILIHICMFGTLWRLDVVHIHILPILFVCSIIYFRVGVCAY